MFKNALWISLVFALAPVACRPFVPAIPAGFVELDDHDQTYDFRATHPDGLVTGVRVIRNRHEGDLPFWSRAVANELRLGKGYRLVRDEAITNHDGLAGRLLEFGHDEGKSPHVYRVGLYIHRHDLFVLEQGGTRDLVTTHTKELDQALRDFSVKTGIRRFFSYNGA
jgi:hypothetical protein